MGQCTNTTAKRFKVQGDAQHGWYVQDTQTQTTYDNPRRRGDAFWIKRLATNYAVRLERQHRPKAQP